VTTFNKPKPTKKVPVSVETLERWRGLVNKASRGIHSNAHMVNADKVPLLGALARVRKEVDDHIQLKLFSDDQLDFG